MGEEAAPRPPKKGRPRAGEVPGLWLLGTIGTDERTVFFEIPHFSAARSACRLGLR